MNHKVFLLVTVFLAITLFQNAASGAVWYVDSSIPTAGNGTNWSLAFKTIQEAITAASAGDDVWVKAGTYTVSSISERIIINKSAEIYGGFRGVEVSKSDRDWVLNKTVINGDDTSWCVEIQLADAVIDGFTITHGKTNWGGGGMYVNQCSPTIRNCLFIHNQAGSNGGGGLHNNSASPTITNCIFSSNYGGTNGGGGIFNWNCPLVTVTNCTFTKNDGGVNGGGAIYNRNSSCTVTNSILWDDQASSGSELFNEDSTLTVSHCDVDGDIANIANTGESVIDDDGTSIDVNPMFGELFHIEANSECINTGTNGAPALPGTDVDGETRISGGICDIGADEYSNQQAYYVSTVGNDSNDGLSPLSSCRTIQHAIDIAEGSWSNPVEIKIAAGTYTEQVVMDSWESLEGGWDASFSARRNFSNSGFDSDPTVSSIIDGEGHRCMMINNVEGIKIDGLTIKNGSYFNWNNDDLIESRGGGALCINSSVIFSHCSFLENHALSGSALYNENSTISVKDCLFDSNISNNDGHHSGCFYGGAICHIGGFLEVENSNFFGNWAYYSRVGCIYNGAEESVIKGCKFSQNGVGLDDSGGGIWNFGSKALIINCIFEQNIGAYFGAIKNDGVDVIIINCLFYRNGSGIDEGGPNWPKAGAIASLDSNTRIYNSTFIDNYGGMIISRDGHISNSISSYMTIHNSIFWYFSPWLFSEDSGWPPSIKDYSSTALITHCNINQDGYEGINGNIRQVPLFVPKVGDFQKKRVLKCWITCYNAC